MQDGRFIKVYSFGADDLPKQMIAHPASFVPKTVYEKIGLYNESFRSSGDWELFVKFFKSGIKFVYTNEVYVNFDCSGISNLNEKLVVREDAFARAAFAILREERMSVPGSSIPQRRESASSAPTPSNISSILFFMICRPFIPLLQKRLSAYSPHGECAYRRSKRSCRASLRSLWRADRDRTYAR